MVVVHEVVFYAVLMVEEHAAKAAYDALVALDRDVDAGPPHLVATLERSDRLFWWPFRLAPNADLVLAWQVSRREWDAAVRGAGRGGTRSVGRRSRALLDEADAGPGATAALVWFPREARLTPEGPAPVPLQIDPRLSPA